MNGEGGTEGRKEGGRDQGKKGEKGGSRYWIKSALTLFGCGRQKRWV